MIHRDATKARASSGANLSRRLSGTTVSAGNLASASSSEAWSLRHAAIVSRAREALTLLNCTLPPFLSMAAAASAWASST